MTENDFLATVYVAKEFCHYVASKSPNMLRWQVTGGYFNKIVRKDTSQVAAHTTSVIKIKFIDALYILRGCINWCFSLSRNTYKQPIVAHAQLTDDNFAACLCLLCIAVTKRNEVHVKNVRRSWQWFFFALCLLWKAYLWHFAALVCALLLVLWLQTPTLVSVYRRH